MTHAAVELLTPSSCHNAHRVLRYALKVSLVTFEYHFKCLSTLTVGLYLFI